jgi:excisionase family DNA binding protein
VAITGGEAGVAARQLRPQPQSEGPRLTYSVDEVAGLLGLSRSKIYELVASGEIPVVPLPGRRKLIARGTLEQLLSRAEPSERQA